MKLVAVIQARMKSTRLPGKVLQPLDGQPLLARMLERVQLAHEPDAVVVATTTDSSDAPIVELCTRLRVECLRGDPLDCLDRHWRVGAAHAADAVVKIPSDCPLIDPQVIDEVLGAYRSAPQRYDYFSNLHPPSWPDGNDVEVMSQAALSIAAAEARDPFDREHTTPFLWSRPERFALGNVRWSSGLDYSQRFRIVVDWAEDLDVVQEIWQALCPRLGAGFGIDDIVRLYAERPELQQKNARYRGYHYIQTRRPAHAAGQGEGIEA
jgi:spore coat polysaccharide biosynthesis protein SpsF